MGRIAIGVSDNFSLQIGMAISLRQIEGSAGYRKRYGTGSHTSEPSMETICSTNFNCGIIGSFNRTHTTSHNIEEVEVWIPSPPQRQHQVRNPVV